MRLERQAGFTLLELVVTLAIVAVLGVMTVPVMEVTRQRVKEQALTRALREIRGALDAYKRAADDGLIEAETEASGYPANLNVLVEGVPRADGKKKSKNTRLYFLRRLPRDPMMKAACPMLPIPGASAVLPVSQTTRAREMTFLMCIPVHRNWA